MKFKEYSEDIWGEKKQEAHPEQKWISDKCQFLVILFCNCKSRFGATTVGNTGMIFSGGRDMLIKLRKRGSKFEV